MKIVVATNNSGKLKEIRAVLYGMPFNVVTAADMDILEETSECGSDYNENALIKAWSVYISLKGVLPVMADDSGIEIDYFNGWPGIFSSRFAGSAADDTERINKIIKLMEGVPTEKRKARFVSSIAVYLPGGKYFTVSDTWEGFISDVAEGSSGFGYDPVFYDPVYGMTAAQLDSDLKNRISHRGKALRLMKKKLDEYGHQHY